MLSFSPRDVLEEILNLIESVSEGFPSYSLVTIGDMTYVREVTLTDFYNCMCKYFQFYSSCVFSEFVSTSKPLS